MNIKEEKTELDYHERLKKVNSFCDDDTKTVWDSIDRPIRPLIYEIYRIGLKTKFSCCGFNYDGEEEPKSHHKNLTYVFVYTPNLENQLVVINFFKLVCYAQQCGWKVNYFNSNVWHFSYSNILPELYNNKDDIDASIHDYESQVLAIHTLTNMIKHKIKDINIDSFQDMNIIDGNDIYQKNGIDEWQVKPKRSIAFKVLKARMENKHNSYINKKMDHGDVRCR